jgi:hypothetical protein
MKIEISEVFVTRTDSTTLDAEPSPIGIAALESRTAPVPANIKYHLFPLCTALYRFVPPRNKKDVKNRASFSRNIGS